MKRSRLIHLLAILLSLSVLPSARPTTAEGQKLLNLFNRMYPGASQVEWSTSNNEIMVSFLRNQIYYDAFYSTDGRWIRTEHIIHFDVLPTAVKNTFAKSPYREMERGFSYLVELPRKRTLYKLYVYDEMWREIELIYNSRGIAIAEY